MFNSMFVVLLQLSTIPEYNIVMTQLHLQHFLRIAAGFELEVLSCLFEMGTISLRVRLLKSFELSGLRIVRIQVVDVHHRIHKWLKHRYNVMFSFVYHCFWSAKEDGNDGRSETVFAIVVVIVLLLLEVAEREDLVGLFDFPCFADFGHALACLLCKKGAWQPDLVYLSLQ
jgi:hypothetical protein